MVAAEANPQGRAAGSGTLVSNILAHLALNITKKNSTFKVSNCGGSRCETNFDCASSNGGGCECKRFLLKAGGIFSDFQSVCMQISGYSHC